MKRTLLISLLLICVKGYSQEMWDNLVATLHTSSLHLFHDSPYTKMDVISYRSSKEKGMVIETEATYRKGKINAERIRFSINYTEYYILEDRKRSLGIYHMAEDRLFDKYERTDFNRRNYRTWSYSYHFDYKDEVLSNEIVRTTEYLNEGSAEVDTAVYVDSASFVVEKDGNKIIQHPRNDETVYSTFILENGRLVTKTNHFEGFDEVYTYSYDAKGNVIKIENNLKDEEGRDIYTYTDIKYSSEGLVSEVLFYDEAKTLLERKEFSYK